MSGSGRANGLGNAGRHRIALAFVFGFALSVHAATSMLAARGAGIPLSHLGVCADGHLYLEIAKSFPLPFSAAGRDYLGQAPGYPALIYMGRLLVAATWLNWGGLALLATWLPAALAAVAFFRLCKVTATPWPLLAALAFSLANPAWLYLAGRAQPEALAVWLSIEGLIAHLRHGTLRSMGWLSLATIARYPSLLLGVPVALSFLADPRHRTFRASLPLALPLGACALVNLNIILTVPGLPEVFDAHGVYHSEPTREL